jgi:tetratricopeptide (TPR) repeat protein
MVDTAQLQALQAEVENAPPAEALAAARQLIGILQPLAGEAPARHLAQLATAWLDYGTNLAIVEGPAAALEPLTTAVRLFQELANDSDAISLLRLAQAQQALAEEHIALEQGDPALHLLQEAEQTCQRLAVLQPDVSRVVEAKTSRLIATMYHNRRDYPNAIRYGRDAETRLRQAMRQEPTLTQDFAVALRTLGLSLMMNEPVDDAQRKEAQKKTEEALIFHRALAKRAPEIFLGEFAHSAYQNATIMMARGKTLRAVGAYEQAADLYAKAMQFDPGLGESFHLAATTAVEGYERSGNQRRAQKLRQRYGV